jgi:hypothetical protein
MLQGTFVIHTNNIPPSLVINSDQTGLPTVPSQQYTRAPRGALDGSKTADHRYDIQAGPIPFLYQEFVCTKRRPRSLHILRREPDMLPLYTLGEHFPDFSRYALVCEPKIDTVLR